MTGLAAAGKGHDWQGWGHMQRPSFFTKHFHQIYVKVAIRQYAFGFPILFKNTYTGVTIFSFLSQGYTQEDEKEKKIRQVY
jgi:hypothetical protein